MERKDIEHLAHLSRIALTPTEADALATDISGILGYVSDIEQIAGSGALTKQVGARYNVMRKDGEPHESGIYTEDLVACAPKTQGPYIQVKKILENKS